MMDVLVLRKCCYSTPRVGPVARVRAQSVWAPCTVKDGEILRGGCWQASVWVCREPTLAFLNFDRRCVVHCQEMRRYLIERRVSDMIGNENLLNQPATQQHKGWIDVRSSCEARSEQSNRGGVMSGCRSMSSGNGGLDATVAGAQSYGGGESRSWTVYLSYPFSKLL